MGDDSVSGPPAKKRTASRQLCKDDGSESEEEALRESGSFQKASEEVLASRRIVKVRRFPAPASSAPNPFAGIRLVPPASAVDMAPASSALSGPAAADSAPPSGNGEIDPSSSAVDQEKTGSNRGDVPQNEEGFRSGLVKPQEVSNSTVLEDDSGDGKSDAGEAKDSAAPGEDVKVEVEAGNQADDDENVGETKEDGTEKGDPADKKAEDKSVQKGISSVFEHISSNKDAFTNSLGSVGSGISTSSFSFGTVPLSFGTPTGFASFRPSWGSASGSSSGSTSAFQAASEGMFSTSSTAFGNTNGNTFQLFGSQSSATSTVASASSSVQSSTGPLPFQEVSVETGEEQEKVVFAAYATLFEFADGAWKERGKGDLKVNVPEIPGGRSRLVMRSKGNYRLLLNASLFPDMKMTSMDSRGVTFVCVNSAAEGKDGMTTYAVKLKDSLAATGFREAVDTHKGDPPVDLKTPENSPRAPHDSGRDLEASEP